MDGVIVKRSAEDCDLVCPKCKEVLLTGSERKIIFNGQSLLKQHEDSCRERPISGMTSLAILLSLFC